MLAVGEWVFSIYKHKQMGESLAEVPDLCQRYEVGKTKLYEVLSGRQVQEGDIHPQTRKRQASLANDDHEA